MEQGAQRAGSALSASSPALSWMSGLTGERWVGRKGCPVLRDMNRAGVWGRHAVLPLLRSARPG